MNLYLSLAEFKGEIGEGSYALDAEFLRILYRASRFIDAYCHRRFYVEKATKHFRAALSYDLFVDDLLTIATIKVNDIALAASDYELEPLNRYPKTSIRKLNSAFANRDLVEIDGLWGYQDLSESLGITCGTLAQGATLIEPSAMTGLSIGQTLKIEDEQLYIEAMTEDKITVKRGVNGTEDVAHAAKTIWLYKYPGDIVQACLIQSVRWHRGRDAVWGDEVGVEQKLTFGREPHPSVKTLLLPYRKIGGGF